MFNFCGENDIIKPFFPFIVPRTHTHAVPCLLLLIINAVTGPYLNPTLKQKLPRYRNLLPMSYTNNARHLETDNSLNHHFIIRAVSSSVLRFLNFHILIHTKQPRFWLTFCFHEYCKARWNLQISCLNSSKCRTESMHGWICNTHDAAVKKRFRSLRHFQVLATVAS